VHVPIILILVLLALILVIGAICRVVAGVDVDSCDGKEGLEGDISALVWVEGVEGFGEVGRWDLDVECSVQRSSISILS